MKHDLIFRNFVTNANIKYVVGYMGQKQATKRF